MAAKNQKTKFYKNKKIFDIDDIDVNKILVSKKETYGKYNSLKYFIAYNDNGVIRPLYLKFSKMTGYINELNNKNKNKITITMMNNILKNIKKYEKKLRS